MQFPIALVSTVAAAAGLTAAALSPQAHGDGAYVGYFEMWDGGNCDTPSIPVGMWSISKGLTETCHSGFDAADGRSVSSVRLQDLDQSAGYTLTVYTSEDCSDGGKVVSIGECATNEDNVVFRSFEVSAE